MYLFFLNIPLYFFWNYFQPRFVNICPSKRLSAYFTHTKWNKVRYLNILPKINHFERRVVDLLLARLHLLFCPVQTHRSSEVCPTILWLPQTIGTVLQMLKFCNIRWHNETSESHLRVGLYSRVLSRNPLNEVPSFVISGFLRVSFTPLQALSCAPFNLSHKIRMISYKATRRA